jgi:prepilin-type N-terminal cleavage/methylation domain-containing protein
MRGFVTSRRLNGGHVGRTLQRGFTLIEIAIVMVVVGLLLSGSLLALAPVLQGSKLSETNGKLDRIEQALLVYVIQNGCLPCPANPSLASSASAPAAGQSVTGGAPGTAYTTGCAPATCTYDAGTSGPGGVPWSNLGLSESDATDAYGDRIAYEVGPSALTQSNGMLRTPPSSYPSGSINIQNYSGTAQTTTSNKAAYVLISYGADRSFAYPASIGGTALTSKYGQAADNSTAQGINANGNATGDTYVQDTFKGAQSTAYFDDVVRWRTAPNIIQNCGTNACGNP